MLYLKNQAILSAMAGITNGNFCKTVAEAGARMVTLGGFNCDKQTIEAGKKIIARGRREFEFEFEEMAEFIQRNVLTAKKGGALVSVNVRVSTIDSFIEVGKIIEDIADAIELNAHCRQPEIMSIGAGQKLLAKPKHLEAFIKNAKKELKIPIIIKTRANVVDDLAIAKIIFKAGADGIHIDAMKPGKPYADLEVVSKISSWKKDKKFKTILIGNNSVTDVDKALLMLQSGADAFSIARAAIKDPTVVGKIGKEVKEWKRRQ